MNEVFMKTRFFALCTALVLTLTLSGCWQDVEEPDTSQTLLEELGDQTEQESPAALPTSFSLPYLSGQTLDPVTCPDGMQQVVGGLLYEGLFQLDTALEPQESLCSGYTYDPATFTYVFTLRTGVLFSDGSALTAQDVVQTLQRARSSARYSARLAQVSSITAGQGTVTIVLSKANTGFAALLDIPIVKAGTESSLVPVGTGPYAFVSDDQGARLSLNSHWWGGAALPVDTISLSAAADRDTMLYQFTSHDVQLITADLIGTEPVSVTGSIHFQDADTTVLHYIGFNTKKAPFDNQALRCALSLGINRDSIISAFLSGHGTATQFPVSPVTSLYPTDLERTYSYDAFAQAMTQAGYNSGSTRTVTLLVNSENSFKVSAATAIAQALSAFDLQVEVRALPWSEYTAALSAGQFDLYYGEVRLTADWNLSALLGTGGSLNFGGWSNAQTDALLTSFAAASDRKTSMHSLCTHLQTVCPLIPICFKSTSVLVQDGVVDGLQPTMSNPFYQFSSCTIHLQK